MMNERVDVLDFVALVRAWSDAFGKALVTSRDVLNEAWVNPTLREALKAVVGEDGLASASRLTRRLQRADGNGGFLENWARDFYISTDQGWDGWYLQPDSKYLWHYSPRSSGIHGWRFYHEYGPHSIRVFFLAPGSPQELDWIERTVRALRQKPEQSSASL